MTDQDARQIRSPEKAPGELVELLRTNARSFMS